MVKVAKEFSRKKIHLWRQQLYYCYTTNVGDGQVLLPFVVWNLSRHGHTMYFQTTGRQILLC